MFYEIHDGKVFAIYAQDPKFNAGVNVVESNVAGVAIGWPCVGGVISAPSITAPTQAQLLAYLSTKWNAVIENGTVSAGGFQTSTAERWQGYLSRAVQGAVLNPTYPIQWNGTTSITQAQLNALQAAAQVFVQDAFNTEGIGAEGIGAGTITLESQIDALAWPVNS